MKSPSGLEISRTLAETCNPGRVALLIYDMQVGIARQIKVADVIIAKVGQLLKTARAANVRTFFTRHMSFATSPHGRLPVANGDGVATCR